MSFENNYGLTAFVAVIFLIGLGHTAVYAWELVLELSGVTIPASFWVGFMAGWFFVAMVIAVADWNDKRRDAS